MQLFWMFELVLQSNTKNPCWEVMEAEVLFGFWPLAYFLLMHDTNKQRVFQHAALRVGLKNSLSVNRFGLLENYFIAMCSPKAPARFFYLPSLDYDKQTNVRQVFNDMHARQPVMIHPVGCACYCYWWHVIVAMTDGGREEMSHEPI